jgi:hypothetical protein
VRSQKKVFYWPPALQLYGPPYSWATVLGASWNFKSLFPEQSTLAWISWPLLVAEVVMTERTAAHE